MSVQDARFLLNSAVPGPPRGARARAVYRTNWARFTGARLDRICVS